MNKFVFELTIQAPNEKDAEAKVSALTTMASCLSTDELKKLAHIVKNDPVKATLAKKFL